MRDTYTFSSVRACSPSHDRSSGLDIFHKWLSSRMKEEVKSSATQLPNLKFNSETGRKAVRFHFI